MADTSKAPLPRSTRGRQKIEIKKREKVEIRRVTFTKRRKGLFEKAAEMSILCGSKVAILTFSEGRKAFCFGNPDPDAVLEGYLNGRSLGEIEPSGAYIQALNESKQLYLEASMRLERERTKAKCAVQPGPPGFWWASPMDGLCPEELEYYHNALERMMKTVTAKIEEGSNMEPGPASGLSSLDPQGNNLLV
ncbi:agamous-like MADS-box protein AGL62 [Punica granatum]|uniref:Agamous-like MADS-box protein AGL62 n=1 Tax=Punica granatum TaxID=22663 RepID=A0A6P8DAX4_PUNGR|nr:agamous-like MADS-box protein AGL62 [Punica granatum]